MIRHRNRTNCASLLGRTDSTLRVQAGGAENAGTQPHVSRQTRHRHQRPHARQVLEPGGYTAFRSHSNSIMLTHPARRQAASRSPASIPTSWGRGTWTATPASGWSLCCCMRSSQSPFTVCSRSFRCLLHSVHSPFDAFQCSFTAFYCGSARGSCRSKARTRSRLCCRQVL